MTQTESLTVPSREAQAGGRPMILVATDGSDASTAAFTAARIISERGNADVMITSILEPLTLPAEVPHTLLDFSEEEAQRVEDFRHRVRIQVDKFSPEAGAWPLEIRRGLAATEIVQSAEDNGASLIIIGATRHGLLDRLIGEETAARIVQLGRIPLLVASPTMLRLPRRVSVAMDLDPSQLGDLAPVLSMLGVNSTVTCVHVQKPEEFPGSTSPAFTRAYESAVAESYEVTQKQLERISAVRSDLIRLRGDPATELLRYAERAQVEMLVLGLRRHFGFRRLLGGGVALKILREASCSVLIVPETVGPAKQSEGKQKGSRGTTITSYDPTMWPHQLKQFTQRNAGRHGTLEVDGEDIGAVLQVVELPFVGADYDRRDERAEILLGDFIGSDRHFTRSIPKPDSISVLRSHDARDTALCITYGGGQTLLTFV